MQEYKEYKKLQIHQTSRGPNLQVSKPPELYQRPQRLKKHKITSDGNNIAINQFSVRGFG